MSIADHASSHHSVTESSHTEAEVTVDPAIEEKNIESPSAPPAKRYPETDLDKGIVGWDGQDDPANPQNFSTGKKWGLLMLVSAITFVSPLASSMFSPAVGYVGEDLGISSEILLAFSVSIYLLGYTCGPLLLAPLSEIYGRRIVLSCANWFLVIWQIGCALAPNIQTLIICRLFAGIGGSGPLTLGAGVIADLFPIEQRGLATAIWSLGPLIGPSVGPLAGGFMGETIGWRWIFWVLMILGGVVSLGIEFLNEETYASLLIRRKTLRLSKELNRSDLRSAYAPNQDIHISLRQTLKHGLRRPVILFIKSPIVALLSLYMAVVYGLLYLFFTTISDVFKNTYGWSTGISGLAYMGIGFGFIMGLAANAMTSDRIVKKLTARNGGKYEPEMRLPAMIFYACFVPASFFWYGWSADKAVFWIVPIIGMAPFGFGLMGLYLPIQIYVIDNYPAYAASANATLTTVRSFVGALLPLAGTPLFDSLGLGWGNSLLGFIALAFIPVPIIFSRFGQRIREKFPVDLD
ncbi:MFS multidrug transporter [Penicillium malachiteum]|uniref:MFS multidrug transporter n=1 Tax=Penicillium malachiteum TaxID=1324776 RepID=A0AAD6MTK8_9EURO|nr:MFS multidrug transporter [Penicillium malachiteum]